MAYIYQITNDVNGKIYIGKTERSIQERWREHCKDYLKRDHEKRPLYSAMKKYGIEHFHIEVIEETDTPEERERFWIEQKRSFKNGYNATLGGDGKKYLDYDLIIATYKEVQSQVETAKIVGCYDDTVKIVLQQNNIPTLSSQEVNIAKNGLVINQYDLQNNFICSFPSAHAAANSLNKKGVSHITDVCKGKRKTAYGFIWRFAN